MRGAFADAEVIAEFEIGKYKLIYEKNGRIYCSENGVPSEEDDCLNAFDELFEEKTTDEPEDSIAEEEPDLDDSIIEDVTGDPATEEELPE